MRSYFCGILLLLVCGTTIASAQRYTANTFDTGDGYVNLLVGGNLGGPVAGGTLTVAGGGNSASVSMSGLKAAKGFAGGLEAGWYKSIFGVEIEDLLVKDGLASSNVTLSGSALGGGSATGLSDKFNATQNFLFANGLARFCRKETTWGLWYPYVGVGPGFVSGSVKNDTTGTSGYSLKTRPAGDMKVGIASTWDNGVGLSAEYQILISGYNMTEPPITSYGVTYTGSLSGTAINSVLNVGVSYHFHL